MVFGSHSFVSVLDAAEAFMLRVGFLFISLYPFVSVFVPSNSWLLFDHDVRGGMRLKLRHRGWVKTVICGEQTRSKSAQAFLSS
jgi:hypothetical protein